MFRRVSKRAFCRAVALLLRLHVLPKRVGAKLLSRALIYERRTAVNQRRLNKLTTHCISPDLPPGALVECGVGKGGCIALMAYIAGRDRQVWGFDSFEGMPEQTQEDEGDGSRWIGCCCAGERGEQEVHKTLDAYQIRKDKVKLIKGWFEDTLAPSLPEIGPIALLRLDSDWYVSTRYCLETLYSQVAENGVVVVDDYHTFKGCRKAVDEFRAAAQINEPLETTDPRSEICWRKR